MNVIATLDTTQRIVARTLLTTLVTTRSATVDGETQRRVAQCLVDSGHAIILARDLDGRITRIGSV